MLLRIDFLTLIFFTVYLAFCSSSQLHQEIKKDVTEKEKHFSQSIPQYIKKKYYYSHFNKKLVDSIRIIKPEHSKKFLNLIKKLTGFYYIKSVTINTTIFVDEINWNSCNFIALLGHEIKHSEQYNNNLMETFIDYLITYYIGLVKHGSKSLSYKYNKYEQTAKSVQNKIYLECSKNKIKK